MTDPQAPQLKSDTTQDSTKKTLVLSSNNNLLLPRSNKPFSEQKNATPQTPPHNNRIDDSHNKDEIHQAEKIYISFLAQERTKDKINILEKQETEPLHLKQDFCSNRNENNNSQNIYKNLNSVIPSIQWCQKEPKDYRPPIRLRKGQYKKTAVNDRIRNFLNDFEKLFPIGCEVHKTELEYWIQRLQLANDRLTIKQYLKRFLLHGYFSVKNGFFTFNRKQPKQPTLHEIMNVKKQIMTLSACNPQTKTEAFILMSTSKIIDALTLYCEKQENALAVLRQELKNLTKTPTYYISKIKTEKAEGPNGPYQKATTENNHDNQDYELLLKDLNEHNGKLTKNALFIWLFNDNTTIGFKLLTKIKKMATK